MKELIKMKGIIFITYVLLFNAFIINAQKTNFPKLTGPYLGQTPPGMTPEIFAPDIFPASNYHTSPSFTPDGMETYWKMQGTDSISMMKTIKGFWTPQESLQLLSSLYDFRDPCLSPDGSKLFFLSKGKLPYQTKEKENIWFVSRVVDHWTIPVPLEECVNSHELHWQISVASNGNLYFTSRRSGIEDLYYSEYSAGKYKNPETLGSIINSENMCETTPFISPDESYIIFSRWSLSDKNGYMQPYISFRTKMGKWDAPKKIENIGYCLCPQITRDGKYLFYIGVEKGQFIIKWVSAKIIEDLRNKE